MPIYEYKCPKCGKTFEALRPVSAKPVTACIHCGGRAKKIVSRSSFLLKGSGWYVTDYKKTSGEGAKKSAAAKPAEKTDKNAKAS
ncbi:MAG TPA: zinc ribbon domain-containing protein [Candidatus Aminicenantes bacterium]|nr:zinc ribbon domain-containing protein [Candidatus Aminicenantes bacterium]